MTAASAAAVLVLAGPASASNLYCGETLTASVSLIGNLDCHTYGGDAITIGHDGVTLNLNGFKITGSAGHVVVENFSGGLHCHVGTTIKSGTLVVNGSGRGIANCAGGNNLTVAGVTIVGDGTPGDAEDGVVSEASSGFSFIGGSVSGVDDGFFLDGETGDLIKGNTITPNDGHYGVYSDGANTALSIVSNVFTSVDADQSGVAYNADFDAGTLFSGNTVTAMDMAVTDEDFSAGMMITGNVIGGATPAGGNLFGIYLDGYDSGDMISGNYVRNSVDQGIHDTDSFNNTYVGNVLTSNGNSADFASFLIEPSGYGPVTMVNNIARTGYSYGFDIEDAYNASVPGGPYSLFSGNTAIADGTDGSPGFYDDYSVGATWTKNVANSNAGDGFYFEDPWRETITGNSATINGANGFYFTGADENHQPLAVTNNSATYNGGFGFTVGITDLAPYPVAGSGNTGGGTNADGDCYLVAGCS